MNDIQQGTSHSGMEISTTRLRLYCLLMFQSASLDNPNAKSS